MSGPTLAGVFAAMAMGGTPTTHVLGTLDGDIPPATVRAAAERFRAGLVLRRRTTTRTTTLVDDEPVFAPPSDDEDEDEDDDESDEPLDDDESEEFGRRVGGGRGLLARLLAVALLRPVVGVVEARALEVDGEGLKTRSTGTPVSGSCVRGSSDIFCMTSNVVPSGRRYS